MCTAALSAGVTEAVIIVTPMDVVKIRLQAIQKSGHQSAFQVLRQMIKYEGFQVLYKGVALTALRQGTNQMGRARSHSLLLPNREMISAYIVTSEPLHLHEIDRLAPC